MPSLAGYPISSLPSLYPPDDEASAHLHVSMFRIPGVPIWSKTVVSPSANHAVAVVGRAAIADSVAYVGATNGQLLGLDLMNGTSAPQAANYYAWTS